MRSLASLRRRYTLFRYNLLIESLKKSLASFRKRYTIYLCITCKWNPSGGVWDLSEGAGSLYLCIGFIEFFKKSLPSLRKGYTLFMYNL